MNFEQSVYCLLLSHGPTDGRMDIRRSVARSAEYVIEMASMAFHTAVQVDCSSSLRSTWRVCVVVGMHFAFRKGDDEVFSMRPTAFNFIHKTSVCVCVFVCVCVQQTWHYVVRYV